MPSCAFVGPPKENS